MTNDFETFEAMAGGLEYVSSLVVRYAILETLYLRDASEARRYLSDAIMGLYAAVLTYLCKGRRYYAQNTTGMTVHDIYLLKLTPSLQIDAYWVSSSPLKMA